MQTFFIILNILSAYKVTWSKTEHYIPLKENTYEYYDLPEAKLYNNGILVETEVFYEKGVNHTTLNVVNSNHVKEFKIDYRVYFPKYGISNTQTINFIIVDVIKPKFLKIPEITMPVGTKRLTEKEIIENIIFEDNYYSNDELIIRVNNLHNVNINIPGFYEIEYELMDPSFNVATEKRYYIVENNNYPEIKYDPLIKHELGKFFNYLEYFKITDKYDHNLIVDVNTSLVRFDKIGLYQIEISAKNQAGLKTIVKTNIEIVDKVPPTLIIIENSIINIYEQDFNYLEQIIISVSDNYNELSKEEVKIEGYVDFDSLGKYEVIYTVFDESNNKTTKKAIIEIKDLSKPLINIKTDLIFDVGIKEVNIESYFNFYDNYDALDDLVIKINDKNINFNKIGTYYILVEVTDRAKNTMKQSFSVEVVDKIGPNVTQINEIIISDFLIKDENYFKKHFDIKDNSSQYDEIKVNVIGFINYEVIDVYDVLIKFSDLYENETTLNVLVYIVDLTAPNIYLNQYNYYHYLGLEIPDLKSFITLVNDNYSSEEKIKVVIDENINYKKIGLYEVIYNVCDEAGNFNYITLNFYVDKRPSKLITGDDVYLNVDDNYSFGLGIVFHEEAIDYMMFPSNLKTNESGIFEVLYVAYDMRGNKEEFIQTVYINNKKRFKKYQNNIIITIVGISLIGGYIFYYKKIKTTF